MSRHRHVRSINIHDELNDDAISDGGEYDMTPEHQEQMDAGLDAVRTVIGDEATSGLSDASLKDALWEYYFDVDKTIQWALDEQERRIAAHERKEDHPDKSLPPLPQDTMEGYNHYPQPWAQQPLVFGEDRPRVPLIYLAQQQQFLQEQRAREQYMQQEQELEQEELESEYVPAGRRLLTPIPEERSSKMSNNRSSTVTSYGKVIERDTTEAGSIMDPNMIPASPSASAILQMAHAESVPSNRSDTATLSTPRQHQKSLETPPSMNKIPEILDSNSKTSSQPPQAKPELKPKKSKLSALALSKASSVVSLSESSRSTGTFLTGSIKTFPGLRPSAKSLAPPSTIAPSVPDDVTASPSVSSHVRRAIQVALEQEGKHQHPMQDAVRAIPPPKSPTVPPSVPPKSNASKSETSVTSTNKEPQRLSKLAMLAQSKASKAELPKSHSPHANREPQQLSKLALLAQIDSSKIPKLPKTTTEYLTPIANGSSVTTAITTSYQSLFSLTDPSRSSVLPKLNLVPVTADTSMESSSPQKRSTKLAMKIKKAQERRNAETSREPEELSVDVSPVFEPKSIDNRALPSEFASLLVSDEQLDIGRQKDGHISSRRKRRAQMPPPSSMVHAAKEREKAQRKKAEISNVTSPSSSRVSSASSTPIKHARKLSVLSSGSSTPTKKSSIDQRQFDISALNLNLKDVQLMPVTEEPLPVVSYAKEKLVEEVMRSLEAQSKRKKGINLVVIGHVDAGKSTLMGRLLYELGKLDEKTRISNERASNKLGKSSFSWAWNFDGTVEERERGITMDIGLESISTEYRDITILDAPGHKDFIPNMISGASQADCALLVVDAAVGEFEAGFERGGQTREHIVLVRSLGVTQLIVAVNKLDQVQWERTRYSEICSALRPFLTQSGFTTSKTSFVPVGAMQGVNLVSRNSTDATELYKWYQGPTLLNLLDKLEPPTRDITGPLRIPISNVFKSQGSSMAASGRICSGVVQIGERLRVLPGDETATVKSIDGEQINVPWAAAGSNVTLYLTAIDPVQLNIGSVLCSPSDLVPLVTSFSARIIVFDLQLPITAGASVELFHHSRDLPATISKLLTILDRTTGTVTKSNPRVLGKGVSAEVEISLRITSISGAASSVRTIPIEPFSVNKEMGRVLLRRGGETIAAGIVLKLLS
ncbi:hypothetical protein APHAL10511_002076 [Amanita phalloides]|nr:hypothetical protein APHAL10511_002076 [Amanita phalloides]